MASRHRRQFQTVSGDLEREYAPASIANSRRNPAGSAFFYQKDHAASASRATNLGRFAAVLSRNRNQLVNQGCRDSRRVAAAQLPFFLQQTSNSVPVA